MQINGFYFNRINPRIEPYSTFDGPAATTAADTQAQADRQTRTEAFTRASNLGNALAELTDLLSSTRPRRARAAITASRFSLNLAGGALTATQMRSSEEVNATPTSFGPFGPDFSGSGNSTAEATINGVYDGSNGTQTLTFTARDNGVHGEDRLRFRVRDEDGKTVANINVKANDPIDREYTLSNGLVFTLGEGAVVKNDTFTVDVYDTVGSVVDPAKAMDGVRNDNPNLEYGTTVTNGSFEVNGTAIAVNASDSINDVLARITASSAGVTASFDNALEQIVLTQNSPGSAYDITLTNDTSGFLAATKLDTATATPGTDGGAATPIGQLEQFNAVTSNTLSINGVSIAVDTVNDSLDQILSRIEASAANVTASLVNNRVYLQANDTESSLELDDGNTGLFDALGIRAGSHDPVAGGIVARQDADLIIEKIRAASEALDELFAPSTANGKIPADFKTLQNDIRSALKEAAADLENGNVPTLGISIDVPSFLEPPATAIEEDRLSKTLRFNYADFRAAFIGDANDPRQGFVNEVMDLIDQFRGTMQGQYGSSGLALSVFV